MELSPAVPSVRVARPRVGTICRGGGGHSEAAKGRSKNLRADAPLDALDQVGDVAGLGVRGPAVARDGSRRGIARDSSLRGIARGGSRRVARDSSLAGPVPALVPALLLADVGAEGTVPDSWNCPLPGPQSAPHASRQQRAIYRRDLARLPGRREVFADAPASRPTPTPRSSVSTA